MNPTCHYCGGTVEDSVLVYVKQRGDEWLYRHADHGPFGLQPVAPPSAKSLTAERAPIIESDFEIIASSVMHILTTVENIPIDDEECQIAVGLIVKRAIERARESSASPSDTSEEQ